MDYVATLFLVLTIFFILFFIGLLQLRKYKKYAEKLETVQIHINRITQDRYQRLKGLTSLLKEEDQDIIPSDELPLEIRGNFDFEKLVIDLIELNGTYKSDELKVAIKEIREMNEYMAAYLKYYNDNATQYNKLLRVFPTNMIGTLLRYKEKKMF